MTTELKPENLEALEKEVNTELGGQTPEPVSTPEPTTTTPGDDKAPADKQDKPETPEVSKPVTEATKPDPTAIPETDEDLEKDKKMSYYAKLQEKARREGIRAAKKWEANNKREAELKAREEELAGRAKKYEDAEKREKESEANRRKDLKNWTPEQLDQIANDFKKEAETLEAQLGKEHPLAQEKRNLEKAARDRIEDLKKLGEVEKEEGKKTFIERHNSEVKRYYEAAIKEFPELADENSPLGKASRGSFAKVQEEFAKENMPVPPIMHFYVAEHENARLQAALVPDLQNQVTSLTEELKRVRGEKSLEGSTVNGKPSAPRKDSDKSLDELEKESDAEIAALVKQGGPRRVSLH